MTTAKKRIALIGSAPSSIRLAPFRDPEWSIWSCSPGCYAIITAERVTQAGDAHFELHRPEFPEIGRPDKQVPWFSPEYVQWMRDFRGAVVTTELIPEIKNATRLPREVLLDKYGPYFFTSSLAWMFAMALETPGIEEIGLWGVDMAATEEYGTQRPGCHYFITLALQRGIKVTIPPESDLMQPHPIYGPGEWNPMQIKLTARMKELQAREANAANTINAANAELMFIRGAIDNMKYMLGTWCGSVEMESTLRRIESQPKSADVIQMPRGAAD